MITWNLTTPEILLAIIYGGCLSFVYLSLLWLSIKWMTRVRHKTIFLFTSTLTRLFLLIFCVFILCQDNAERFLWIMLGFLLTRLVVVGIVKSGSQRKKR